MKLGLVPARGAEDAFTKSKPRAEKTRSHLQVVLLAGVQGVAPEVRLELYVVFKRLIGRREGHRGEKLNHQTKKGERTTKKKGGKEATEYERRKEN